MDFRARHIQRVRDHRDRSLRNATERRLQLVKDRQQRAIPADMRLDHVGGEIGSPRFVCTHKSDLPSRSGFQPIFLGFQVKLRTMPIAIKSAFPLGDLKTRSLLRNENRPIGFFYQGISSSFQCKKAAHTIC